MSTAREDRRREAALYAAALFLNGPGTEQTTFDDVATCAGVLLDWLRSEDEVKLEPSAPEPLPVARPDGHREEWIIQIRDGQWLRQSLIPGHSEAVSTAGQATIFVARDFAETALRNLRFTLDRLGVSDARPEILVRTVSTTRGPWRVS